MQDVVVGVDRVVVGVVFVAAVGAAAPLALLSLSSLSSHDHTRCITMFNNKYIKIHKTLVYKT